MTRPNKFEKAVAAREAAVTAPPSTANSATMKTTVVLTKHTRAELSKTLATLGLQHGLQMPIGPVGAALYEMFLADAGIQREVISRLT